MKIFRYCTLIALFLSIYSFVNAQPSVSWDRTYGSVGQDVLLSMTFTEDGGFLLAGGVGGEGGDANPNEQSRDSRYNGVSLFSDMWAIRTDTNGYKIWDHRYGGDSTERCWKVIQNSQGYLLIGESNSNISGDKTAPKRGGKDFWVVQIRPDGSKVWDKTYGGSKDDVAFSAVKTDDNGYIILGHSESTADGTKTTLNRGGKDLWLIKIDKDGNQLWDKDYGGSGNDEYPAHTLVKTPDGGYLIGCGSTSNKSIDKSDDLFGGACDKDFWIIKVDKNGDKQWDRSYGGIYSDELFSIENTPDGNFLLGGTSHSNVSGNKTAPSQDKYFDACGGGVGDYWVLKINQKGDIIWDRDFGGTGADNLTFMYQNITGYTLIGGATTSSVSGNKQDSLHGGVDWWFCYLDKEGLKIWDKTIGGSKNDVPQAWVLTPDRGYVIGGHSNSDISFEKSENARRDPKVTYDCNTCPEVPNDIWLVKIKCVFDVNLGPDTAICKSDPRRFDATIPHCPNCIYQWSDGETTPVITVQPTTTTTYKVSVTATDACLTVAQATINIVPSPDLATYRVVPPHCSNGKDGIIALDSARGGTPPYYLIVNKDTLVGEIFAAKKSPNTYQVALVDKNGCKLWKQITVPNPDSFMIQMPAQLELTLGDSFRLKPEYNHKIDTFWWSDRNLHSLDTILKPLDSYTYTFTAVDSLGCRQSASEQVIVRRSAFVFAPNIFTPSNPGHNDYFLIYGSPTVRSIDNLKIFNRWGGLVYESAHIYPARDDSGWDGNFAGRQAPTGVYVYIAEVTYLDGRVEVVQGDVTLLR